ncbi:MAG: UDP-N-acetylglucosamine diphosphorylase/glucosamine-1-phosphate N-acetyltransferase [Gammaproteobacteria bacterium]|nr:UDP-N-acetylglucosamine diphosphorylase/glucosamine-1-phosphate N-acetyltransferase [Gammaproteobacteria bacterium]
MKLEIVILAAGQGTRMFSSLPKVLHRLGGKPLLAHVLESASSLDNSGIHAVVGHGAELVRQTFESPDFPFADIGGLNWVLQEQQLGTGHAVQQAMPQVSGDLVLVLSGDVPLVRPDALRELVALADSGDIALLTLETARPEGLGRIVRGADGTVQAIVEERDADPQQKRISEVNSGIMVLPAKRLRQWLDRLDCDNAQREYYLTDVVAMARAENCPVRAKKISYGMEAQGVNDQAQLAALERHYQMGKAEQLMAAGVRLQDPARVDVRGSLTTGQDVEIDVNVVFEGEVSLGDGVKIGPNCVIRDAGIAAGTHVLSGTTVEGAVIGADCNIGPMARLRPGTELAENVKIGNFVETKKAKIGRGSKANHLCYLGDVEVGENVNIGAGVIVCNYDGEKKHRTTIGNNVFVGSNSVLVAPVTLQDDSFVAAGSTVSSEVPAGHLAVGRSRQKNISRWKRPGNR